MSAPTVNSFTLLDRLIVEAFTDLRCARAAAQRTGDRQNLDSLTRAEEHLNALLEYRHAAARRASSVGERVAPEPRTRQRLTW